MCQRKMEGQSGAQNAASNLLRFPRLSPPFYRDKHLFVSLRDRLAILDSRILTMTPIEYRLLALLVEHAGEVVPRPDLLTLTPMVDTHLWRLRKKLGRYAYQYIEAVGGFGYRFRPLLGPLGSRSFFTV